MRLLWDSRSIAGMAQGAVDGLCSTQSRNSQLLTEATKLSEETCYILLRVRMWISSLKLKSWIYGTRYCYQSFGKYPTVLTISTCNRPHRGSMPRSPNSQHNSTSFIRNSGTSPLISPLRSRKCKALNRTRFRSYTKPSNRLIVRSKRTLSFRGNYCVLAHSLILLYRIDVNLVRASRT